MFEDGKYHLGVKKRHHGEDYSEVHTSAQGCTTMGQ